MIIHIKIEQTNHTLYINRDHISHIKVDDNIMSIYISGRPMPILISNTQSVWNDIIDYLSDTDLHKALEEDKKRIAEYGE